jgi:pimeloyl-ACP methyl ester carboxylesterase
MPFYDAGDAAIYYEIEGQGLPLVLLHGYALNSLMWEFQKDDFINTHTIIAIDLRGFGKSSCSSQWSGAVMAEDVIGLIGSLNLKDVTILGFSMSGPIAFRVAYELPKIIVKLVLVSSILPSAGRPKAASEEKHQQKELDILRLRGADAWADAMGMFNGPLVDNMFKRNPDIKPLWNKMIERHDAHHLLCMLEARKSGISNVDWRSRLKDIKQQTLIISGSQDNSFIDASRFMANEIPNSKLIIIKGAGHMVNLEEPEQFNQAVLGFAGNK